MFLQVSCFDGRLVKPKSWWMDKGKFFMELNFVCCLKSYLVRNWTVCKTVKNMSPSLAAMIKATRWPEGFKFWRRERNKIATFAVMYHVHVNSFPVWSYAAVAIEAAMHSGQNLLYYCHFTGHLFCGLNPKMTLIIPINAQRLKS